MPALSPWHLLLIGVVAILLFGNRLPEVARSLGRSVNEFKRGLKEVKDNFDEAAERDETPREKLAAPSEKSEPTRVGAEAEKQPADQHETR